MKVMGGEWTLGTHGVLFDAFRAQANTSAANEFAQRYRLGRSASFTLTLYGEEVAIILCQYWIAKMNHFFGQWTAGGGQKYVFKPEDVASFVEPEAFTEAFAVADGKVLQRMETLRNLRPQMGR